MIPKKLPLRNVILTALCHKDINGQYATAHGGTVVYDKDTGEATFVGKHSGRINYSQTNA